jgi:hypothetical protein
MKPSRPPTASRSAPRLGPHAALATLEPTDLGPAWLATERGPDGFPRLRTVVALVAEPTPALTIGAPPGRVACVGVGPGWAAFDYVSGESLGAVAGATWAMGATLPVALAVECVRQAASALSRDAPGTLPSARAIDLGYDGVIRVLAAGAGPDTLDAIRADPERLAYLAPEVLDGEPPSARADVFALGVALWEVTVGVRLFHHPEPSELRRRLHEMPIPRPSSMVPGFPSLLEDVLARALSRDPEVRHPDLRALAEDLAAAGRARGDARPARQSKLMRDRLPQRLAVRLRMEWAAREPDLAGGTVPSLDTPLAGLPPLDPSLIADLVEAAPSPGAPGTFGEARVATVVVRARGRDRRSTRPRAPSVEPEERAATPRHPRVDPADRPRPRDGTPPAPPPSPAPGPSPRAPAELGADARPSRPEAPPAPHRREAAPSAASSAARARAPTEPLPELPATALWVWLLILSMFAGGLALVWRFGAS